MNIENSDLAFTTRKYDVPSNSSLTNYQLVFINRHFLRGRISFSQLCWSSTRHHKEIQFNYLTPCHILKNESVHANTLCGAQKDAWVGFQWQETQHQELSNSACLVSLVCQNKICYSPFFTISFIDKATQPWKPIHNTLYITKKKEN